MPSPKVFLFIDNSNIFISAKAVAEAKEGRHAKDNVRIAFERILKLAVADRDLGKVFVVGSIPPEQRAVWDRLEHATGVRPELFERGEVSGGEQGLDQCLQVHMLRAISDNPEPQVVVLMTGDGAGYDDGVGFHADMERMWAAGWGVEVITWEASCRRSLREWAKSKGCFIRMEDHYESVTFIQGGRRAKQLDLTKRPKATPKLSPTQIAAQKTRESYERKLASLQAELEASKVRKKEKEVGRTKYEKRVSKGKN